jgi:hypothetical protein
VMPAKRGQADASGAFRFEDVPMQDGWVFAAMLSHRDVTFFFRDRRSYAGDKRNRTAADRVRNHA